MSFELCSLTSFSLDQSIGQCRAVPVNIGHGKPAAFLVAYGRDFDVDAFEEMFYFPKGTLKLAVFTVDGEKLWERDLGPGVVPGMWFTPIMPVDLDGDGADEIFLVGNEAAEHPLSLVHRRLERLDVCTGETTGRWPWPRELRFERMSHVFRFFLLTGQVRGEPVLVTAQGTYGAMYLQGWNRDLSPRWKVCIPVDAPGARGSHMTPVIDWDGDGNDEFFWGERLLRFDDGRELFCADREEWEGHSDVIAPFRHPDGDRWWLFTCRETPETNYNFPGRSKQPIAPRVAVFDEEGRRVWGALEEGHMDMGFVARIGRDRRPIASAIRIGAKSCGPDGRFHAEVEDFFFDPITGERREMPWSAYRALPVDLDGDGRHEFVRGAASGDGALWDADGRSLGSVGGPVAMIQKVLPNPGEQLLSYHPDGRLQLWGIKEDEEEPEARLRFEDAFIRANRRLGATGNNIMNTGGR